MPVAESLQGVLHSLPRDGSHVTVCLAPGVHEVSNLIAIERSHVTLRSAGPPATLKMEPGVSSPVLVIGDAEPREPTFRVSDVTIEGLKIVGNDSEREFHPHLRYLSNSAVVVRSGDRIELRELAVTECRSACLLTEHGSRNVTIAHNTISSATWDGISLNRAGPTRVIGNVIRDNTAAGITVEHLRNGEIIGNRIEGNGSHGIYLADAENNVFRDNEFENNHLAGIFLTCSVRSRDPVQCWRDSISHDNLFTSNRFASNRFAYQIAVDDAANCLGRRGPVNTSRGDSFTESRIEHPSRERYGDCLLIEGAALEQGGIGTPAST